jgi:hypothetical protein
MRSTPIRLRSLGSTAATLAAVAALAGACGGDDGDDSDDTQDPTTTASSTLTEEQAEQAALTPDTLGTGWTEDPAEEGEDEAGPGCLGEIDAITDSIEETVKVDRTFRYEDGLPQVTSSVSSYPDEDALIDVFDRFETEIENCTTIEWEEEGFSYNLTITPDADIAGLVGDDQNGFTASGTLVTPAGDESPLHLHATFVRVGPNIASISTTGVEDASAANQAFASIAAERLAAVASGEEPPATTAPPL